MVPTASGSESSEELLQAKRNKIKPDWSFFVLPGFRHAVMLDRATFRETLKKGSVVSICKTSNRALYAKSVAGASRAGGRGLGPMASDPDPASLRTTGDDRRADEKNKKRIAGEPKYFRPGGGLQIVGEYAGAGAADAREPASSTSIATASPSSDIVVQHFWADFETERIHRRTVKSSAAPTGNIRAASSSSGFTPPPDCDVQLRFSWNHRSQQGGFDVDRAKKDLLPLRTPEQAVFHAHRLILSAESAYFQTLFSGEYQDSLLKEFEVEPSIDSDTFLELMDFVYFGRCIKG
eukprot:g2298.t1